MNSAEKDLMRSYFDRVEDTFTLYYSFHSDANDSLAGNLVASFSSFRDEFYNDFEKWAAKTEEIKTEISDLPPDFDISGLGFDLNPVLI